MPNPRQLRGVLDEQGQQILGTMLDARRDAFHAHLDAMFDARQGVADALAAKPYDPAKMRRRGRAARAEMLWQPRAERSGAAKSRRQRPGGGLLKPRTIGQAADSRRLFVISAASFDCREGDISRPAPSVFTR
jgi:hypothetical protein